MKHVGWLGWLGCVGWLGWLGCVGWLGCMSLWQGAIDMPRYTCAHAHVWMAGLSYFDIMKRSRHRSVQALHQYMR